jgi:hypothetical protein
MGSYRHDSEGLGVAPVVVAGGTAVVGLIKDSAAAAAKQAERMAQNAIWFVQAKAGNRGALARLHVMGGQGTDDDRDTILAAEGQDIGPPPWGWATTEAQKDAITKYNSAANLLGVSASGALPVVRAVVGSPITYLVIGSVVLYAVMKSSGRKNW